MSQDQIVVGLKIKSLRESKNLSVEEIAERSGLSVDQINNIENVISSPKQNPFSK